MNILFFTHYAKLYGANRSLLDIIQGLKSQDVNVLVILPKNGDLTRALALLKVDYQVMNFYTLFYSSTWQIPKTLIKYFLQKISISRISSRVKKFNPDLVYSNSSVIDIGYEISKIHNKPHIWHVREFRKEDYSIKYLFGENSLLNKIDKANLVIVISNAIKKSIHRNNNSKNVKLIYNGIVKTNDISKSIRKFPQKTIRFGIVGLIQPSKGQLEAVEAYLIFIKNISSKRNCYLNIFGEYDDIEYEKKIHEIITNDANKDTIILHGFVTDLDKIYDQVDCLLMCSKKEGLGRVTIEAMARGIPVIGYNSGGTIEIVENNFNGLLYDGSVLDLSKKMENLFQTSEVYEKFSENSLKCVKSKFTTENFAEKMSMEFEKILRHKI